MSLAMAGMITATSKATGTGHLIFRAHTSMTIFTVLSIKGCMTTDPQHEKGRGKTANNGRKVQHITVADDYAIVNEEICSVD